MEQKGKTLLALTGITTAALHIINRVEFSRDTMKKILLCSENKYYEWRFGKVKYTKKGSGSPILLLHDLTLGSSSYEFYKLEDALSQKHEIYSVDFLGYGLSDKPEITYTTYLYVQMVTDFIKNIIGRKTDIITSGDAFPIAVMACHNDGDIIRKMAAINPPSLYLLNQIPSRQTRILKLLLETPILGTFIYNLHAGREAFLRRFREEYFYCPYNIKEKDIDSYLEAAHTSDYHCKYAYASYLGTYLNTNIVHALKEINNSIYLIAGAKIPDCKTVMQNYAYYNNAMEISYIPNTKRLPHLEKPGEVLSLLNLYLD